MLPFAGFPSAMLPATLLFFFSCMVKTSFQAQQKDRLVLGVDAVDTMIVQFACQLPCHDAERGLQLRFAKEPRLGSPQHHIHTRPLCLLHFALRVPRHWTRLSSFRIDPG
jgi:hypothetical protein